MNQSKVSIIIPILDGEGHIGACLESLMAQEQTELEILCIDGGSKDRTLPLIEEAEQKDSRIRFFSSNRRSSGHLLNLGIQEAEGAYVAFLLPGDTASPELYAELVRMADGGKLDLVEAYDGLPAELCGHTLHPAREQEWASLSGFRGRGIYRRSFLEEQGLGFRELPGMEVPWFGFRFRAFLHASKAAFLGEGLWQGEARETVRPWEADNFFKECDFLQADLTSDKKVSQTFGRAFGRACCLELHEMLGRFPIEGRRAFLDKAAFFLEELQENQWIDYYGISAEEREMVSRLLLDSEAYGEALLQKEIRSLEEKAGRMELQLAERKTPAPFHMTAAETFGKRLRSEEDPLRWFELLGHAAKNFLVILTVKDTPGDNMPDPIKGAIRRAGFGRFRTDLWRTYVGVLYRGRLAFQQTREKEARTDFSYRSIFRPLVIEATSQAWRKGNRGDIRINGENLAVNFRGVNVLVYDVESGHVLDSIGYDSHEKGKECFAHLQR